MYLATLTRGRARRFEIRQSIPGAANRYLDYQVIFDLGTNPGDYIERLSDDICYFSAELEDLLCAVLGHVAGTGHEAFQSLK